MQTAGGFILALSLGATVVVTSSSPAHAQGLTGREREAFVTASNDSCFRTARSDSGNSDLSSDVITRYCSCYSNRMADVVSSSEVQQLNHASQDAIRRLLGPRIDTAIAACLPEQRRTAQRREQGREQARDERGAQGRGERGDKAPLRQRGTTAHAPSEAPARQAPASTVEGPSGPVRVALHNSGGVLTVPVLINNAITLEFVVDSGASSVAIPADVALTLRRAGTITQDDVTGSQTFITATGESTQAPIIVIRSLKIGSVTVRNVQAAVAPAKGDLLLGQSFLRQFRSWHVDNRTNELVLVQ